MAGRSLCGRRLQSGPVESAHHERERLRHVSHSFEYTFTAYCTLLMIPFAGFGALMEGADGRGLVFQMTLPPKEFEAMSSPAIREHLHRFRSADDDIPRLHHGVHG
jgi:hypothetical protein